MAERIGDFMCTFSGKKFWPADPRPEDVCLEDVAHALSIENRFGGHLPEPYSVAQHCVLTSHIVESFLNGSVAEQKWALLHDAAEAYAKDIPRPLKTALGGVYKDIEKKISAAIAQHFGLVGEMPAVVKKADEIALTIERRDLFPGSHQQLWVLGGTEKVLPPITVSHLDWRDAKRAFLRRFAVVANG